MPNVTSNAVADGGGVVVWVHGDHLSATNPALAAYPNAPVVFVFDEPFLREANLSFHRIQFLYESVMDVFAARPAGTCTLLRGAVPDEVRDLARSHGASLVATTQTVGARFAEYKQTLEGDGLRVRAYPVRELVTYPDVERVPKRFSAWWREVEGEALRP